jgi:pilus assembly protein CpaE
MSSITVLIADDIPATREDIKRLLYFEEDISVIGEAEDGNEAMQLTESLKPDVVLMDVNMPRMDGISASEIISMKNPEAAIVIVSIQGEKEYLRKAMAAGARDYLVKPFSSSELAGTIRKVSEMNKKRRLQLVEKDSPSPYMKRREPGKMITLFSTKGGVGKTTTACNLAISMIQETKKKVALVDLNLQGGDVAVMLNITSRGGLAELVQENDYADPSLLESYLSPHLSGIRVLLSPSSPELAETVPGDKVEEILKTLKDRYDFVVVDTAAALTEVTLACLELTDHILLVLTQDLTSLKHARSNLGILEKLNLTYKTSLLLNREKADALKVQEVEKNIGLNITTSLPEDERTVATSVNKGQPFVLTHPGAPIARALMSLGSTLARTESSIASGAAQAEELAKPAQKSLISKLFSF